MNSQFMLLSLSIQAVEEDPDVENIKQEQEQAVATAAALA